MTSSSTFCCRCNASTFQIGGDFGWCGARSCRLLRRKLLPTRKRQTIASLSLVALPPLPADPTNKYADDPAAAAFGATLFFDQRLSRDGNVACGTCHLIDRQFQDDLPRGKAVGTTQPAHHAAGRRRLEPVSLLGRPPRQPVGAGADAARRSARACRHARRLCAFRRREFSERYQRIFGPLPDLSGVPSQAGPRGTAAEQAAWAAMSRRATATASTACSPISARRSRPSSARSCPRKPASTVLPRLSPPDETRRRRGAFGRGDRRAEAVHRQGQLLDLPHRAALHRRCLPQHRRAGCAPACRRISAGKPA